ncbi:MAG: basic amino acid ABC transporter substrate-binding protein [Dehalococcoidia bacterium]|nr:MAG: basic amino acid ABC transporter substrate-binding protein [Dehalococcoidia bacterium]
MKRFIGYVLIGLILCSIVLTGCGPKTTKIRIATDATWPPFESVNEQTKEIEGFDIDLMTAIAERAGLEIEFINVAWDPLLAGIAQCQYDAAISAMTITEERKKQFLFSDPYFEAGQLVIVRIDNTNITDKDALAGKVAGAQIGTTGSFEVEKIEGATLKTYDDIGLAMQDLMNGQIDAVVADNPLALGYVGKNPDKLKAVGEVFTEENYGIAVCKTKADLVEKINAGLKAVKEEGLIEKLVEKWLSSQ